MMRRTLGAPLGGTTRGGHHGVESLALSLITPPNGIGGGGSCFPSSVTVALGEPGTPVICWADAGIEPKSVLAISRASTAKVFWHRAFIERYPSPQTSRKRPLANRLPDYDQGIMPHSNILLATGAAIRSMNIWRIRGSLRRKFTASCSLCDFGCPRSCHNCSHEEFWYFWMTLLATLSSIGYWALLTPANSRTGSVSRVTRRSFDFTLDMVFSPLSFFVCPESLSAKHPRHLTDGDSASRQRVTSIGPRYY